MNSLTVRSKEIQIQFFENQKCHSILR